MESLLTEYEDYLGNAGVSDLNLFSKMDRILHQIITQFANSAANSHQVSTPFPPFSTI